MNDCFVRGWGTLALPLASSRPKYEESKHRADDVEHDSPPTHPAHAHNLPSTPRPAMPFLTSPSFGLRPQWEASRALGTSRQARRPRGPSRGLPRVRPSLAQVNNGQTLAFDGPKSRHLSIASEPSPRAYGWVAWR